MNCRTKSKGHPSYATAPAEGVPVVLQFAPALPPAGQAAGGPAKSPPHFIEGDCERWSWEDVLLLCRRGHMPALANLPPGGQRYLATKYLLSLADGEKGLRKAIVLLRENIAAKNQAALRKLEEAGNGAGD